MTTYLVNFIKGDHKKVIKIDAQTKDEAKKIGIAMCKGGTVVIGYTIQGEPEIQLNLPKRSSLL